jgi:uncharacterized protein (DUF58 family)
MPPSGFNADLSSALNGAADPLFLRKLRRFRLAARHRLGHKPGNTPTPFGSQPSGLELANHKPYVPGDDLRHFDWNAYGRLDQMMVKTYRAERESPLHVLIDTSASMGAPAADRKLPFAAAVATSLAYVCLRQNDPVQIFCLGGQVASWASPSFRHPQRLPELQSFLACMEARGPTTLHQGIELFLRTTHRPGLVVVLSDFLMPRSFYEEGLERLCARKYGVAALRIIGSNERNPDSLPRRVRLHDAETGKERVIDLTDAHRLTYKKAVQFQLASIKAWCESRAITFATLDSDRGIEPCLLDTLPRVGLLR